MKHVASISPAFRRTGAFSVQALLSVIALALMVAAPLPLAAQGPGDGSGGGFASGLFSFRPILVRVEFEGNSTLSADQLQAQIQTRATHISLLKRYFALMIGAVENVQRPSYALAPNDSVINGSVQLRRMIDSLGGDIRYLNTALLAADMGRIRTLYNDFGHHDVAIEYKVIVDSTEGVAAVRFIIDENVRYPLRAVTYSGLENVPADIRADIVRPQLIELGDPYSRPELSAETERVVEDLRNNGYAYATSRAPLILVAREADGFPGAPYDSAVVFISTGTRYRFGETTYRLDEAADWCTFSESTIQLQREYQAGEWYSKEKADQTVENIYALGTYDLVTVDTSGPPVGDILPMEIVGRLRRPNDFRGAPEFAYEQRLNEFLWSAGASASYTRLNAFCSGGHLTVAGRFTIPVTNFGNAQYLFNRGQGGATVSMHFPSFAGIRRNSMEVSGAYDNRVEGSVDHEGGTTTMRSQKIQPSLDFTWRLPKYTFLSSITFRAAVQHTQYKGVRNFITRLVQNISSAVEEEDSLCDSAAVFQPVFDALLRGLFRVPVLQGDDASLVPAEDAAARDRYDQLKWTVLAGVTVLADQRDVFFTPTRGVLVEGRLELGTSGFGAATYLKGEFNFRRYSPWFAGTFAWRVHLGYIQEFGQVAFTPSASRFVAGGANSMRGWYERDMLATRPPEVGVGLNSTCAEELVSALNTTNRRALGGLALIELSAEHRVRPFHLMSNSVIAQQFNQIEVISFIDAGNAFFRDRRDIGEINILKNIGVDIGVSLGYSTPVGPFRVGVAIPVYDPVNSDLADRQRAIFNREFLSSLVFHVGIGHAF